MTEKKEVSFVPQFEPLIKDKYIDAVVEQIKSGWIGPHKTVKKFEQRVAQMCGVEYCVATTSGTTALLMALESLNIQKPSNIIFPAYTFLAGANAAKFMGHDVKLLDVNYDTLCLDPKEVMKYNGYYSAVIFVNHNGYLGNSKFMIDGISIINRLAHKNDAYMIEDTSQCLGMFQELVGDVGIISFSVPKIVTTGQGGAVITNDQRIYERCLAIRDHGGNDWKKTKTHVEIGVNFKFNDILAAYGLSQLNDIGALLEQRDQVFDWYRAEGLELVDFNYPSTWMVIYRSRSQNATEIVQELRKNNIGAEQYYKPIHYNLPYHNFQKFPVAEKLYSELVYLPSSLNLTHETVKRICDIVKKVELSEPIITGGFDHGKQRKMRRESSRISGWRDA